VPIAISPSNRDRNILVAFIAAICALAWAYLIYLAAEMPAMHSGSMAMEMALPMDSTWDLPDFISMFVMWSVMMVAMMLPSATPMILLFDKINQKRKSPDRPMQSTAIFISGYLLVWVGISVVATLLNWALHISGNLSSMMGSATLVVGGVTLIIAGMFQWTPLKYACLSHCRSPIGFLTMHWDSSRAGPIRMGFHHGLYCLGCCWMLMALLFVLGVMNLLWIAVLTLFVLIEKLVPSGQLVSRIAGLFMIAWGAWLLIGGVLVV
jgi:predicted metal-binding membrane protein